MKTRHVFLLLFILTLLTGLMACGKGEGKKSSNLDQAMAMAPTGTQWFYFTDWALIKEYEGFTDISSQNSIETKMKFLMFGADATADPPKPMRQASASAYGIQYIRNHAEVWGWDITDLAWEITIESSGPPLYVLQFNKDFDLGPFLALLNEREFTTSEYQGVTVYSHEMSLKDEWLSKTGAFAILNTGVLEKENRLVLSAGIDNVHAVLDAYKGDDKSLTDDSAATATAEQLGEVASAIISSGPELCGSMSVSAIFGPQVTAEQREELIEKLGLDKAMVDDSRLHPYLAFGVGYRYKDDTPVGLIVFHYSSAATAEADLELRRQWVDEGTSLITRAPFSEALFTIEEATIQDTDLVWRVRPANDMPRRLFDMVYRRDLLFAICQ